MSGAKRTLYERWKQVRGPFAATLVTVALIGLAAVHAGDGAEAVFASRSTGTAEAGTAEGSAEPDNNDAEIPADASEGAVFLLRPEAQELLGVRLADGRFQTAITLDSVPRRVVPTPGGVSVFVLYEDSGRIDIYSAETFEFQRRIETGLDAILELSFSPNGDRVYTVSGDGERITEFQHSMLELSSPRPVEAVPGTGPLVSNRRGTRLYRAGRTNVYSIFSQTLQVVDEYPGGLLHSAFDPGFTELWGIAHDGHVRVVDERSGTESFQGDVRVRLQKPTVTNRISYLSEDGTRVLQYRPRSSAGAESVELDSAAVVLVRGVGQTVWAVSENGFIQEIADGRIVAAWNISNSEVFRGITGGTAAVVRRDGSFACF